MAAGRAEEAGELYRARPRSRRSRTSCCSGPGWRCANAGDLDAGLAAVRKAAEKQPNWLVLLDRLSDDFAPAGETSGGRWAVSRSPAGGTSYGARRGGAAFTVTAVALPVAAATP